MIAGVTQAMDLARWVFAVPGLAAIASDPAATAAAKETAIVVFNALHQYAGVALGEHIGQIFTALWVEFSFPRTTTASGSISKLVLIIRPFRSSKAK